MLSSFQQYGEFVYTLLQRFPSIRRIRTFPNWHPRIRITNTSNPTSNIIAFPRQG